MTDNASIAADIAEMNRLMKVYATFDAESLIAKLLNAEIDRLSDVIEAALKAETPDLVTQVAMQFAGSSWDGYNVEDRQFVRDDTERALAYLAGTGRLIPAGGMALTAEQVEDVRTAREALRGYRNFDGYARQHVNRLIEAVDALFPATESAEDAPCAICNVNETNHAGVSYYHPFTTELGPFDDEGNDRPAPAEPAEEETKAVTFDEIAQSLKRIGDAESSFGFNLRFWRRIAEKLIAKYPHLASSPVVPAPTETGPWQRIEDVPEGVFVDASGAVYVGGPVWRTSGLRDGVNRSAPFFASVEEQS